MRRGQGRDGETSVASGTISISVCCQSGRSYNIMGAYRSSNLPASYVECTNSDRLADCVVILSITDASLHLLEYVSAGVTL